MKETGFALDFSVAAGLGIEKALSNTKTAPSFRLFCSKTAEISPSHVGQHIGCKMHMCVCLCVRLCVAALVFTLGFAVRDPEGSLDVAAVQDEHVLKDPLEVESCFMEDPRNCSSPFRKYMITNWSVEVCSGCVEPMKHNFTVKCVKENSGFGKWDCPLRCQHAGFNCAEVLPKAF